LVSIRSKTASNNKCIINLDKWIKSFINFEESGSSRKRIENKLGKEK